MKNSLIYEFLKDYPYIAMKIFEYDGTYKEKYDKVIKTIKSFPIFTKNEISNEINIYYFKKNYNFFGVEFVNKFCCKTSNYKKSFIIVIKAYSRKGTILF